MVLPQKKLSVQRKPTLTTRPKPTQPSRRTVLEPTRDPLGNALLPPRVRTRQTNPQNDAPKTMPARAVAHSPITPSPDLLRNARLPPRATTNQPRTRTPAQAKPQNHPSPPPRVPITTPAREDAHTRITPSPDLPAIGPADTPVPAIRPAGIDVLGLGTPEVDRWVEAGRRSAERERRVAFDGDSRVEGRVDSDGDDDSIQEQARERSMTLQLSPQRSPAHTSTVPVSGAQDLLRTLVRDAMHEMQRETRAGLTGLHLDLLRAGRGWRHELRAVMAECGYGPGGELERLREENRQLRVENERLRRGV